MLQKPEKSEKWIVFDRELIPDAYLEEFVETYRKIILELGESKRNPTFFEVTTLLAFKYFAERKAQYASVEVGLGGASRFHQHNYS